MLGIELDSTRKMELGFMGLVMVAISLVVWWQWGYWSGSPPRTIVQYTIDVPHGADLSQPVSAKNPIDGTHTEQLTVFATNEGKVEFSRFAALPTQGDIRYTVTAPPARQRTMGGAFGVPFEKASTQHSPARLMTAWACYCIAEGRSWAFATRPADPTPDQNKALRALASELHDKLQAIVASKADGSFNPQGYKQLQGMLSDYAKLPGDPAKDPNSEKARAAWKIYDAGRAFAASFDTQQDELVAQYAQKMYDLFDASQHEKLAQASGRYTSRLKAQTAGG